MYRAMYSVGLSNRTMLWKIKERRKETFKPSHPRVWDRRKVHQFSLKKSLYFQRRTSFFRSAEKKKFSGICRRADVERGCRRRWSCRAKSYLRHIMLPLTSSKLLSSGLPKHGSREKKDKKGHERRDFKCWCSKEESINSLIQVWIGLISDYWRPLQCSLATLMRL